MFKEGFQKHQCKNLIIEVTTELIEQHNGNIKDITVRMIAAKADVGLGS
ncbi:MAG: hypothetical protein HFH73_11020 [Lachnospiraceae bacterium]|jgi:AcrR family transcriptional regulator|nr:hypothetical protein [Lachnospiraceae bacterium]